MDRGSEGGFEPWRCGGCEDFLYECLFLLCVKYIVILSKNNKAYHET